MIMKKVYSLCKNAGMFNLIDDVKGGLQWLGNAEAYYPLEGCPIFDEDSFCATFDIPEKKREKWIVARHDGFGILGGATPYDVEYEEELRPIENVGMPGVGGLMALTNTERIWFIPLDCIEATGTSIAELTFWARRDNRGMTYIAVMRGIVTAALIWTRDVLSERYVRDIRAYTELCTKGFAEGSGVQMQLLQEQLDETV
jgi:hypothetical protein